MKPKIFLLLKLFYFIIPLLLVISPVFIQVIIFEDSNLGKLAGRTLLFCCLFSSPAFLFFKRIKWYFYFISPLLLLSLYTNYLFIYLKTSINVDFFFLFLDANQNETSEFISNLPVSYFILSLLAIIIYFVCVRQMPKTISIKKGATVSIICLTLFFSLPILRFGISNYADSLTESTLNFYPFNIFITARDAINLKKSIKNFNETTKTFSFNAKKRKIINEKEIHVLIIGEASRKDHWGLYGYPRNTSPLMDSLELVVFSDAVSSGYITSRAVPIMLTGAEAKKFNQHTKEKGILHAFKEADFKTYYICTQSGGATDIDIHAKEGDYYMTPSIKYEEELKGILLNILKKEVKNKIFLVFHTSGSHWRYDLRYPDKFDTFKPSMKKEFITSTDKSKRDILVNTYDNTILYSDYVLNGIIKVLDSINAVSSLTFISDHGENLLDDSRDLSLHAQATKACTDIPLFIWTSKAYQTIYPDKFHFLKANKNKKISTENIFYSLLDIADIEIKSDYSLKSFVSPKYNESERFVITESGIKPYRDLR